MKNIKSIIFYGVMATMALFASACSDDAEQSSSKDNSGDHVWKTQTDALQSAKDMAKKMEQSLKQQQEQMNDNN